MFDYILYLIGFNPTYYYCEYETYEDEKPEEKKEIRKLEIKKKTMINNYDDVIKELKLKLIQRNYHNKLNDK